MKIFYRQDPIVICFILTIVLLKSGANSVEINLNFENTSLDKTALEILQEQIKLHVKPSTIWIIDGRQRRESTSNFLWDSSPSTNNILTIPLLQGRIENKTRRNSHPDLAAFIFLVFLSSDFQNLDRNVQNIRTYGNIRRDRYFFIGNEGILDQLFRKDFIIGLRHKIGLSWDTKVILCQPEIYDPTGAMVRLTTFSDMKPRPQMGQNLRGRHLKITGTLLPHWLYRIANAPNGDAQFDGSHYRIISESGKKFNFTFEIYAPPHQGYGTLLPNGTWIGQVADIYYKERNFDLAILLGHVRSWYSIISFAGNLGFANLLFVTQHPQTTIGWEAFFNPFTVPMWIAVQGTYVVIAFSMFLCIRFRKFRPSQQVHMSLSNQIRYALVVPLSIALEQNVRIPKSIRNLCVVWMLAIMITGMGYKSNLASYLSSPSIDSVPTTYEQLAAARDYKVILNNLGEAEASFFQTSESSTIVKIRKRLQTNPDPIECSRLALVQPKTVCISWSPCIEAFSAGSFAINSRLEPLLVSKQPALPVSMSIGFPKDSALVDSFTPITNGLYETGIYSQWKDAAMFYHKSQGRRKMLNATDTVEFSKVKEYEESLGSGEFKPFSVKNLKFSFVILALGSFIGLGFFLGENLMGWNSIYKSKANEVITFHHSDILMDRLERDFVNDLGSIKGLGMYKEYVRNLRDS